MVMMLMKMRLRSLVFKYDDLCVIARFDIGEQQPFEAIMKIEKIGGENLKFCSKQR